MSEFDAPDYTVDEPMPEESPMPADKPLPIERFRSGQITLATWRNVSQQDDREIVSYSATIEKRYRDKTTDEWLRSMRDI